MARPVVDSAARLSWAECGELVGGEPPFVQSHLADEAWAAVEMHGWESRAGTVEKGMGEARRGRSSTWIM